MPAAFAIPAIIGGATSLIGGAMGAGASKKAAQQQAAAAQQAADVATKAGADAKAGIEGVLPALGDLYKGETANLDPYLQAGAQGVGTAASMLNPSGGFNLDALTADPGYQFQLKQGAQALARAAAARGGAQGGAMLKDLTSFNQGMAATQFGNAYARALQLAGVGQTATGQYDQATQQYGNQRLGAAEYEGNAGLDAARIAGDDLTGKGNAQAAGTMGAANAWSGAVSGIGKAAQGAYDAYGARTADDSVAPNVTSPATPLPAPPDLAPQPASPSIPWNVLPPPPAGNAVAARPAASPFPPTLASLYKTAAARSRAGSL